MENVVLLKDILKDNQYPEAGVLLFKIAKEAIDNGETLILNMSEIESVPTVFMNTSFGELIALYGIEKTKKVFLFKSITKAQLQRIRKYFADYENIVMKKIEYFLINSIRKRGCFITSLLFARYILVLSKANLFQ